MAGFTFTGAGTVYGTGGTVSWPGIGDSASYDISSWKLTRSQSAEKKRDGNGKTRMIVVDPETVYTMALELVVKADSMQHAQDNILIAGPTTVVTLSGFPSPSGNPTLLNCSNWRMTGDPEVSAGNGEEVKISITIEQILGNDVLTATQLTTQIV